MTWGACNVICSYIFSGNVPSHLLPSSLLFISPPLALWWMRNFQILGNLVCDCCSLFLYFFLFYRSFWKCCSRRLMLYKSSLLFRSHTGAIYVLYTSNFLQNESIIIWTVSISISYQHTALDRYEWEVQVLENSYIHFPRNHTILEVHNKSLGFFKHFNIILIFNFSTKNFQFSSKTWAC